MLNKLRYFQVFFLRQRLCRNFISSKGAVTAEAAVASLSMATILGMCLSVLVIVHTQFLVFEAARTGSRMLARGESEQVVLESITNIAPMSEVNINYSETTVTVWVSNNPLGVVPFLQTTVTSHATAGFE
jgi:hypothetical protein